LTIRNSKLTLEAFSARLSAFSEDVRWEPTADSCELHATVPMHTACSPSPLRATAKWMCGRKKLPFAGYSVVKELEPEFDYLVISLSGHLIVWLQ